MTLRISFIAPLLLAISTAASSMFIYLDSKKAAENNIRSEVLTHIKMDITRLQNILYNRLTVKDNSYQDSRLNLSVTAMDPLIRTLILVDENNKIILANRYALEGAVATQSVNGFDQFSAQKIKLQNIPVVNFLETNSNLLRGYYPVILQLERSFGQPIKRVGVLFVEASIAGKLSAAYREAAIRSIKFAGVMLFVSILVAFLLHYLISRRLNILNIAAEEFADGKFDVNVNVKGNDELSLLGRAFNDMAARIKEDMHRQKIAASELRKINDTLEERIQERTELLNEAQSLGHIGNWVWDVASGELYWSDEIFRIFGYEPGEILPAYERFLETVHPEDLDVIVNAVEAVLTRGEQYSIDHRIILPDGKVRWVHEEAVSYVNAKGQAVTLNGTVQDITDRKLIETSLLNAKNEAERSNEAKSDFLSHMSHELRTPLNAILGFSQVLNMDSPTEKQRGFIDEIIVAGNHLLSLINELLDLNSIETGRMLIVLENLNLGSVLNEAFMLSKSMMEINNVSVNLSCESEYKVLADKNRLRQVLLNLLSNAAKYNRKGGSVSISCESDNDTIKIFVTDTGAGLTAEKINKLFIPFERVGAELTGIDGTGIGLALSKKLIELMNGKIGVESSPGEGSTFWIELPVTKQNILPDAVATELVPEANYRILYIEDNISNIRLIEAMLGHFRQVKLMSANNGTYGIELAQEYKPNIILLDINLPDLSGYQVLEVLRKDQRTAEIPVIAISADAMPLDIERGLEAGFNEYLTKPVELNKLIDSLNKFGNFRRAIKAHLL